MVAITSLYISRYIHDRISSLSLKKTNRENRVLLRGIVHTYLHSVLQENSSGLVRTLSLTNNVT